MLPCSIRRRSCSGEESTSSIWSALRTTQSGTRSRTFTPVMCSTSSAMLSRCWMFTVVMTLVPAQHRVQVHLRQPAPPVLDLLARDDLQAVEQPLGARPPVALDEADDHIGAAGQAAPALVEHRVCL